MTLVKLGELVEIKGGGTPDKSIGAYWGGTVPWASVKDFKTTEISQTIDTITEEGVANSATNIISANSILVPTRMAVGKAAINTVAMAINQDLKALTPKDHVDIRYLLHALLAKAPDLERQATGATVKGITLDVLRSLKLPLPPLNEQKRIAEILDQADEVRRKRQRAIDRLNQLGQAIFYEMFGDIGRLDRTHAFSDVATIQQSLVDPKLPEYRSELHVGPEHIASGVGNVAWDQVRTAAEDNIISGKNRFKSGDIIYSKIRPYLNKVAIADRNGLCSADMYVIQPIRNKSDVAFLRMLLMGADFLAYAETCSNRANIPKLNRNQVEGYRFNCPAFEAQQEFAERMAKIEATSVPLVAAAKTTSHLFASLQHRAFQGKL